MNFKYQAFGVPIYSEIELKALMPYKGTEDGIHVIVSQTPEELQTAPNVIKPFSQFNEKELLYKVPEIGNYYIRNGQYICIEPKIGDLDSVLLYFYSNALAAAIMQRNSIPLHVSGVLDPTGKVILFAGNSGAGKSTTATFLKSKGYSIFTDDTCVLTFEGDKCYAYASYPMTRLWNETLEHQNVYQKTEGRALRSNVEQEKFGFYFHEEFLAEKREVANILILQEEGAKGISIDQLSKTEAMTLLSQFVYRRQWLAGMKKNKLVFTFLTEICKRLPVYKAVRPKGKKTFDEFSSAIAHQFLQA